MRLWVGLWIILNWSWEGVVFCQYSSEQEGQGENDNNNRVFRWVRVVEAPFAIGDRGRVRVWGTSEITTDSAGVNQTYTKFLGIPFGVAPTGTLRFQRPTLRVLGDDHDATSPPPSCPQIDSVTGGGIGEEDCLFLNIYVPNVVNNDSAMKNFPVMVWLHGPTITENKTLDPFATGSAMNVDPIVFMTRRVVVVVPQYRLGTLGFASTSNEDLSGNMGLFDQLLALEWVQRFITDFNGDNQQVTLVGGGGLAGGIAAGLLATAELPRGLFHRVVLMGGSPLSPLALDPTPKLTFAEVALQNSCPTFPTSHFARCMSGRRLEHILSAQDRLVKGRGLSRLRLPLPVIQKESDGRFLPPLIFRLPLSALRQSSAAALEPVPLIIGVTSLEMRGYLRTVVGGETKDDIKIFSSKEVLSHFLRALLSRLSYPTSPSSSELVASLLHFEYFSGLNVSERMEQARDLLEEMLSDYLVFNPALSLAKEWSRQAPVYFYLFEHSSRDISTAERGNPIFSGSNGADSEFLLKGYSGSALDRQLASIMTELWTNFVHKGSPLNAGVEWPQWREDNGGSFLVLSADDISVRKGFRKRQVQFWDQVIPQVVASATSCPSTRSLSPPNRLSVRDAANRNTIIQAEDSNASSSSVGRRSNRAPILTQESTEEPEYIGPQIYKDVEEYELANKFFLKK